MNKMMLVEHLWIVFFIFTVLYLVFMGSALVAQLLDFDHTCKTCKNIWERLGLLLKCGQQTNLATFPQECYALHRGFFHNVGLFYLELLLLVIFTGFVIGHGIHLIADGYVIFKPEWIRDILSQFI